MMIVHMRSVQKAVYESSDVNWFSLCVREHEQHDANTHGELASCCR